jgi:GH18 family chitinase
MWKRLTIRRSACSTARGRSYPNWAFLRGMSSFVALLGCACALAGTQVGSASARRPAAHPRPYESVLFWLAWDGGELKKIPWRATTQVNLFSLSTCVKAGDPAADCTGPASLSAKFNGVSHVGSFVSTVHRHGKLAMISIGGSTNPNWYYPCGPSNVAAFATNLVRYMEANRFDGIDLDIEQDAGTGSPALTAADLRACTRAVHRVAKSVKTARGRTPLITSDVDPTTNFDIGRIQKPYVDRFNAMSYGARGSALASQITALETNSRIPASKITAGLDIGDYPPPKSDCAGTASYAAAKHLAGVMLWFGQADAPRYSCMHAIAVHLR